VSFLPVCIVAALKVKTNGVQGNTPGWTCGGISVTMCSSLYPNTVFRPRQTYMTFLATLPVIGLCYSCLIASPLDECGGCNVCLALGNTKYSFEPWNHQGSGSSNRRHLVMMILELYMLCISGTCHKLL
jgi:hypothetical protein